jgi:hypothetical protein
MLITDLHSPNELDQPAAELPVYLPPTVTTYTDAQLLEVLGPATARSYGPLQ